MSGNRANGGNHSCTCSNTGIMKLTTFGIIFLLVDVFLLGEIHRRYNTYKSKYNSAVIEQYKAAKSPIPRTMGYAHASLKSPQEFLKKHSSQPQKLKKSQTERNKCVACQSRKNKSEGSPPVSKYQDTVLPSTEDCKRNFIQENVLQAVKRPNTTPMKRIRDNRKGDPFVLEESGWVPKYSQKEDYGKTPSYIDRIKQNLKLSQEKFSGYMTAKQPYDLPTELRKLMIEGLVKNLKILFNKYLTLPLHIETPAQKIRKIGLERKIDELQKDIDLIQRNEEILVLREEKDEVSTFSNGERER